MNLRQAATSVKCQANRALRSLEYGLKRPTDNRMTLIRIFWALIFPLTVGGVAAWMELTIPAGHALTGLSIISGVLLALCTIAFDRVKDLSAQSGQWSGADPMLPAYRFARGTLAATQVALIATGISLLSLFLPPGGVRDWSSALLLGLIFHLGARIWFLLAAIRHQVETVSGQRSAEPPTLKKAS